MFGGLFLVTITGWHSEQLFVLLRPLRHDPYQVEEVLRLVAQQGLQVADEPVHVPLARRLVDDVLVVVVAQPPTQLLVVHLGLVFPQTPTPRNLRQSTFVSVFSDVLKLSYTQTLRCSNFQMLELSNAQTFKC